MPIGPVCRTCGAALSGDVGWCARCLAPVASFASRPPLHDPGTFVGTPISDPKTSRWRAGPTTMGPLGRIGWTVGLLLFLPWWALLIPLRSVWRRERIADDAPPSALDRFRARHPMLGAQIRLGPVARLAIVGLAAAGVIGIFVSKDGVDRYLFAAPILVVGLTLSLARWNDL